MFQGNEEETESILVFLKVHVQQIVCVGLLAQRLTPQARLNIAACVST